MREASVLDLAADAVMSVEGRKGDAFDVGTEGARDIVRAVLMAVREPSDAMIDAAIGAACDDFWTHPRHAWPAMVDQVLGDRGGVSFWRETDEEYAARLARPDATKP